MFAYVRQCRPELGLKTSSRLINHKQIEVMINDRLTKPQEWTYLSDFAVNVAMRDEHDEFKRDG